MCAESNLQFGARGSGELESPVAPNSIRSCDCPVGNTIAHESIFSQKKQIHVDSCAKRLVLTKKGPLWRACTNKNTNTNSNPLVPHTMTMKLADDGILGVGIIGAGRIGYAC